MSIRVLLIFLLHSFLFLTAATVNSSSTLYRWARHPQQTMALSDAAEARIEAAIRNPEFVLTHWINLPTTTDTNTLKPIRLSLEEAILIALRYNPNIQNAKLDRILQRYQLRLAQNEFELQFALGGTAFLQNIHYSGIGSTLTKNYMVTPEVDLKNKYGGQLALKMDNSLASLGSYNPLVNLSINQPLLRGFGRQVNEANLKNAKEEAELNKLMVRQTIMDQVTEVILAYRSLILSGNNVQTQSHQLEEAKKTYEMNQKKIKAGQLERTANIQQSYQIETLKLMLLQAQNEFNTASANLLQTLGLNPELKLSVPNDLELTRIVIPKEQEAIPIALRNNVQYLAFIRALHADERNYAVAKNAQLWQLDLNANVQAGTLTDVTASGNSPQSLYNGRNISEAAGITLSIPIRDISRRSQLITAKIQLEKDRLNLIAARRALITLVKNTLTNLQSQVSRYELAKRQVELAKQSYLLEKKKREVGISSGLDVNNTQNQFIQAQESLIDAKIAYLNEMSNLQRIMGTTLEAWNIKLRFGE